MLFNFEVFCAVCYIGLCMCMTEVNKIVMPLSCLLIKFNLIICCFLTQVSWGKKALLVGGRTDPGNDRVSGSKLEPFLVMLLSLFFCA